MSRQIVATATSNRFSVIPTLTRRIPYRASITNNDVTSTISFNCTITPSTMAPLTTHGCRINVSFLRGRASTIIFTNVTPIILSFFYSIIDDGITTVDCFGVLMVLVSTPGAVCRSTSPIGYAVGEPRLG